MGVLVCDVTSIEWGRIGGYVDLAEAERYEKWG